MHPAPLAPRGAATVHIWLVTAAGRRGIRSASDRPEGGGRQTPALHALPAERYG